MSEQDMTERQKTERPLAISAKKRRRVRYAAPLGFLVLFFAVIGVVSTLVSVIGWFVKPSDDSALRQELYEFLEPVMLTRPSEFTDAADAEDQEFLLSAAVYRVVELERIRQLHEKDETSAYETDESGWRMKVPETVVENAYRHFFGDVKLTHRSVGEIEYSAEGAYYYVPCEHTDLLYTPVLGDIKKADKTTYTIAVAFVSNADLDYDEKGNLITPSFDKAKIYQTYTVGKTEDGNWILRSVSAEKAISK